MVTIVVVPGEACRMRVSEMVVAAFFAYATGLALVINAVRPLEPGMLARILVCNAIVSLMYLVVWRFHRHAWTGYARDWIPQALILLAYKEMGWFASGGYRPGIEMKWVVWDRLLLDPLHLRAGIEALGPVLPSMLELSYMFVYALPPITAAVLYCLKMRDRLDLVFTIYLLGLFLSYGQFPFWPSEPPHIVFPDQDMPAAATPFRDFNLWLVRSQGIHTSVFPSAHVSGVVAAAMAMLYVMPKRRGVVAGYFIYAGLVALATIYGRYHYAVDAGAGIVIGLVARPLGGWLYTWQFPRRQAGWKVSAAGSEP